MLQLIQIKELAGRPGNPLTSILLENVKGINATRKNQEQSPVYVVATWWSKNMPGWTPLEIWQCQLRDASSVGSRG